MVISLALLNFFYKNIMEIPSSAFNDILQELQRRPLHVNNYRKRTGDGRSQCFGLVNRRSEPVDWSRWCWIRPKLYFHLQEFARQYVDIPWTSITVNHNYQAKMHKDKGNEGESFLVAFGDYDGGDLKIYEGDLSGNHNIKHKPIKADFGKVYHSVEPFTGTRYSLVFYTLKRKAPPTLPEGKVVVEEGKYWFKRGDKLMKTTDHLEDHPMAKGNSAYMKKIQGNHIVSFE